MKKEKEMFLDKEGQVSSQDMTLPSKQLIEVVLIVTFFIIIMAVILYLKNSLK